MTKNKDQSSSDALARNNSGYMRKDKELFGDKLDNFDNQDNKNKGLFFDINQSESVPKEDEFSSINELQKINMTEGEVLKSNQLINYNNVNHKFRPNATDVDIDNKISDIYLFDFESLNNKEASVSSNDGNKYSHNVSEYEGFEYDDFASKNSGDNQDIDDNYADYSDIQIGGEEYIPHDEELQQLLAIEENPYFSPEQKEVMANKVRADYEEMRRAQELSHLREMQKRNKRGRRRSEEATNHDYIYTDRFRAINESIALSTNADLSKGKRFLNRVLTIFLAIFLFLTIMLSLFFNMLSYSGGRAIANTLDFDKTEIYSNGEYESLTTYVYNLIPSYLRANVNGGAKGYLDTLQFAGLKPYISELSRLMINDVINDTNVVSDQSNNLLESHFLDKINLFSAALQVNISSGDLSWLLQQYTINNLVGYDWKNSLYLNDSSTLIRILKVLNMIKYQLLRGLIALDILFLLILVLLNKKNKKILNYLADSLLYVSAFILIIYILPMDFYLRFSFSTDFVFSLLVNAVKHILLRDLLYCASAFVILWTLGIFLVSSSKKRKFTLKK